MQIRIETNFPQVRAALSGLRDDVANTATARALNATIAQAKTAMSREIRGEYSVSASYVRDRLHVTRAVFRAGRVELSAELRGGDGKRRSANVIAFDAKQTLKGVSVRIRKGGSRKVISHAFIGNKGRTVFTREGKARLPIKPVRTIDIPQMFNARNTNRAVMRAIDQRFPVIFERELAFALGKFSNATR